MREMFMPSTECRDHVRHATAWVEYSIYGFWVITKLFPEKLHAFYFHDGENRRHMINMGAGVKNSDDQLSNLPNWVRSTVELVIEEWMHGFEAILECRLDGLDAFFDGFPISWNLT